MARAEQEIGQLPRRKAQRRLARLIEREEALSPPRALRLAVHLGDEDAMVSVLAALGLDNADRVWRNLNVARRVCPPRYEANVLALLAAASWLEWAGERRRPPALEQLGERSIRATSATVPIALCEALEQGRVKPNTYLLTAAFGAGLTWGAAIIKWGDRVTPIKACDAELPPCDKSALELIAHAVEGCQKAHANEA